MTYKPCPCFTLKRILDYVKAGPRKQAFKEHANQEFLKDEDTQISGTATSPNFLRSYCNMLIAKLELSDMK